MRSNRLQLNTSNTEILWSTTSHCSHQLSQSSLRAGTDDIIPTAVVQDLGTYIDSDVSMRSHVTKTVCACFAIVCQLQSVRWSVPKSVLQSLTDISCSDAAGLRKDHPRWHPAVSAQVTSVDELCCSAGVLIIAVLPLHSTSTALVEGKEAN